MIELIVRLVLPIGGRRRTDLPDATLPMTIINELDGMLMSVLNRRDFPFSISNATSLIRMASDEGESPILNSDAVSCATQYHRNSRLRKGHW